MVHHWTIRSLTLLREEMGHLHSICCLHIHKIGTIGMAFELKGLVMRRQAKKGNKAEKRIWRNEEWRLLKSSYFLGCSYWSLTLMSLGRRRSVGVGNSPYLCVLCQGMTVPHAPLPLPRLRELCVKLMFLHPVDYGRKAEELLWRKVYYEVIQLIKTNKKVRKALGLETTLV